MAIVSASLRCQARSLALVFAVLFVGAALPAPVLVSRLPGEVVKAAQTASMLADFEKWFASRPREPIVLPTDGARVLVVRFSDYLCPACGDTYLNDKPVFAKFQAEHPGAVKLIAKDFPLEPECNPTVGTTVHEASCEAAAAVRLAQRRQRGPAMADWLYTHQAELTPASVRVAAREVGGVTDFDAEYPRVLMDIRNDVELARRLKISRTPTFFINGVRVEGGLRPAFLEAAIEHELRAAAAKP
jgi:protein-disulfide isomerase